MTKAIEHELVYTIKVRYKIKPDDYGNYSTQDALRLDVNNLDVQGMIEMPDAEVYCEGRAFNVAGAVIATARADFQ